MSTAFFFFRHHLTYKRVACSCCTIKVAHALQVFLKLNNTNQKSLSGPVTLIRIQPTHAENKRKKKKNEKHSKPWWRTRGQVQKVDYNLRIFINVLETCVFGLAYTLQVLKQTKRQYTTSLAKI